MGKETLGELEHQVLLALLRKGGDAYSAPIVLELEKRTGRDVAASAVYIALRRLEDEGLVSSELRSPGRDEGGRHRRYFQPTDEGVTLLRRARRQLVRLWDGLEPVLDEA